MSKRLQVLLDESELAAIRRAARQEKKTTAEWVRHAIRTARRLKSGRDAGHKLAAVRAAAACSFPTADIDQMLMDIERGYSMERSR